jgi:hypothetical protein
LSRRHQTESDGLARKYQARLAPKTEEPLPLFCLVRR